MNGNNPGIQNVMNALVSIITPVYNAEKFVGSTIESVLAQTYTHWEMILIEDCSRDNSAAIISEYAARDHRLKVIRLRQNGGVVNARNTGIEAAQGEYISFLDSDDQWHMEKLSEQLKAMSTGKNFAYTNFIKINAEGVPLSRNKIIRYNGIAVTYKSLLKTNSIPNSSAIYNCRELGKLKFKDGGTFKNGKKVIHEDYVYWLTMFATGGVKPVFIDEPLLLYRVHSNSLSSSKIIAALSQWNIYRKHLKLSRLKSAYFFASYFVNGILKTIK